MLELEGVGVTQSDRHGTTYQVRLKFGKQAYCVIELQKGEDPEDVASKLRELATQVAARSDG
jgi:hypothetical protein